MTAPSFTMPATDAVRILTALAAGGVGWTVGGGWAVDALVGRPTREHSDLDLWVPAADLDPLITVAAALGVDRLLPYGGDRPWNFVLHDGGSRKLDLHLYEVGPNATIHYGSALGGHSFPAAALDGRGVVGSLPVRCDAPEWSLSWHTGYPPRPQDHHDVAQLCTRFGFDPPDGFRLTASAEQDEGVAMDDGTVVPLPQGRQQLGGAPPE